MLSKIKDGFLATIKDGLPMVTTTMGAVLGASKTDQVWKVSGYAGLGWLAGHLTQRAVFALVDHNADIPEQVAPLSPKYSQGAQTAPAMPATTQQAPAPTSAPGAAPGDNVVNMTNYGSQGFDPSATGS